MVVYQMPLQISTWNRQVVAVQKWMCGIGMVGSIDFKKLQNILPVFNRQSKPPVVLEAEQIKLKLSLLFLTLIPVRHVLAKAGNF